MSFTNPQTVEQTIWAMKLGDYPRALNRTKINQLLDGFPPYSQAEVDANMISTNVAFPENGPTTSHDARRQLDNALLAPDPLFTIQLDYGPQWQRQKWGNIITKEIGKIIKNSAGYNEMQKGINSMNVAHGLGPVVWPNKYAWCPDARGIEDVLIPSNTLLDLKNLPFFGVYEQYTAFQLWQKTHGPRVDPGWNMPLVESAINWVDQQAQKLMSPNWPEVWSPEKIADRVKQDGGLYATDAVPTIDTWTLYWYDDSGKKSGWRKKIILDAWGNPGIGGGGGILPNQTPPEKPSKIDGKYGITKSEFLYDSGNRKYADKLSELIHLQVANVSNVAPFRYHSVRSLGFLIYSVCHLQNRLRCKLNDATFEGMMQYFRVKNLPDAERALKVNLTDKTPIPDGLEFVKQQERWQVQDQLIQMAMAVNRSSITESSASYSQDYDAESGENETATRTMARVNSTAALVQGMTTQAYTNRKFRDMEICRRFCIQNSRDPDVRRFRVNALRQGVPEEALNVATWDVQPTRVIGSGNKMLQVAMADKLMAIYPKLEPTAQKEALRLYIAVNSDDYDMAQRWVPETNRITQSIHDAQVSAGVMLQGGQMGLVEGVNHSEYVEAMMVALGSKIQEITQQGGNVTQQDLIGMQNLAGVSAQGQPIPGNGIQNHINIIAQDAVSQPGQEPDNTVKELVKTYEDHLGVLMNQVKKFAQNLQEQQQQAQEQAGGPQTDPAAIAKVQGMQLQAQTKAQIAQQSHADKTAQRQISFETQLEQQKQKHQLELDTQQKQAALDLERQRLELKQKVEAAKKKSVDT